MERLKLAGFGRNGFVQDIAEYDAPPESFNEVRNVRFNSIGAVAFSGHRSVLSPAPINPLWIRVVPPVDFPRWVYADLSRVYVFDDGHIDISRPGGYNGILNERWQGEVFNGVGIFNNTVDVPQMWTAFSSAIPLADLTNWPANLRTKFLRPYKNFIMAGFLTENGNDHPFRLRWSHPADPGTVPSSWQVGNPIYDSGEMELSETDDYIVDGRTLGENFMVYKQKTAHMVFPTRDSFIMGQRTVISGRGALTRDCIQDIPGGHFVAGIDDVYVHTGQKGSEVSLFEAKLRKWVYNQIDASNFFNCYTVDYRAENEIWFCFPEAGEIYPTIAVIWNKVTGGIGIRDIQASPFMWSGPVDERTDDGDIWGDDEEEEPDPDQLFALWGREGVPHLASTDDLDTWTPTTVLGVTNSNATDAAASDTAIVVCGIVNNATQMVIRSLDNGTTWQDEAAPWSGSNQAKVCAYNDGVFLVAGGTQSATNLRVARSTDDGETWTEISDDVGSAISQTSGAIGLRAINGNFYLVTQQTATGTLKISKSPDGLTWEVVYTSEQATHRYATFARNSDTGRIICIINSEGTTSRILYSDDDGEGWTLQATGDSPPLSVNRTQFANYKSSLAYGNSIYVCVARDVGGAAAEIHTSTTGIDNWTSRTVPDLDPAIRAISEVLFLEQEQRFVAICSNSTGEDDSEGYIIYSDDGITWTPSPLITTLVGGGGTERSAQALLLRPAAA
jgi:hypothetical protein